MLHSLRHGLPLGAPHVAAYPPSHSWALGACERLDASPVYVDGLVSAAIARREGDPRERDAFKPLGQPGEWAILREAISIAERMEDYTSTEGLLVLVECAERRARLEWANELCCESQREALQAFDEVIESRLRRLGLEVPAGCATAYPECREAAEEALCFAAAHDEAPPWWATACWWDEDLIHG
jgi:hypothetical protein